MNEEIKAIYPEPPKPIDLQVSERRKMTMDAKFIGKIFWSLSAIVGVAALGYGYAWFFRPEVFGEDPLAPLEAEEAGRIRAIINYCNRGSRDSGTCMVWIASYKQMLTGEVQQMALFDKDSATRIAEMKRHRGLEAEAEAAMVPGKSEGSR